MRQTMSKIQVCGYYLNH